MPSARRQGTGAQLIESVTTWARTAGATALVLDVVAANAPAVALYTAAGFVRVDDQALGERAPGEIRLVRSLSAAACGEDALTPSSLPPSAP
jgi:ribosomal-protein-alanine N-acetyltransferase